ncbi:unnamed protein product [Dracunculus medinensis]|uniref:Uncharacterized protein n=1 Tax=Dracunculus medinensis TaxID=318479 RepID=A0A0N4UE48_DRAME|nr:unnamed protein product [Dracunculus medinensis]
MENGKFFDRPINLLYPLKINGEESGEVQTTTKDKLEEPIARRTRGDRENESLFNQWISDIPFNLPQKWNCNDQFTANFTLNEIAVYTKTHIRMPALKCNNITRTVCTKVFLRLSLSVESHQTTTSATTSYFWKAFVRQTSSSTNGIDLKQISPNQWRTAKSFTFKNNETIN